MTTRGKTALTLTTDFEYDVAISFASEQRPEAEAVAVSLRNAGAKVFYDWDEQANLWGKDLYEHLAEVYQRKARFCLMLVSSAYANKVWTSHERKNAQARAISQKSEYILPVRFDDTEIPGLPSTVAYLRFEDHGAEGICLLLMRKLGLREDSPSRAPLMKPAAVPDLGKFWEQRKRLPDTELLEKIWSRARWRIWICPLEFRKARFQSLDHCLQFVRSAVVEIGPWSSYPWISLDSVGTGDEWIAGETELSERPASRVERWVLFRSGQFVYNNSLNEIPELAGKVHAREALGIATATVELDWQDGPAGRVNSASSTQD